MDARIRLGMNPEPLQASYVDVAELIDQMVRDMNMVNAMWDPKMRSGKT